MQGSEDAFNCRILESRVDFVARTLEPPLVLSTGTIASLTEARVSVVVRAVSGGEATGHGNIFLSDLWAWPDISLSHEYRDRSLRDLTRSTSDDLWGLCGGEEAHPMELGLRLHQAVCHAGDHSEVPVLARSMCLSPFDAALHDAVGQAEGVSGFDFYEQDAALPSAEPWLGPRPAETIRQVVHGSKASLAAWLVVGKSDDLDDLFNVWVRNRGYFCFKIKIMGEDARTDAQRVNEVYIAAREAGVRSPRISVDSNEANPDPTSVLEFLNRLEAVNDAAYGALEYLEQPTARDVQKAAFDWREVARRKAVMLDEGLTGPEVLPVAVEQGWSGLALKTCKGHSFALLAAAWAASQGMKLTMQDLTNPGYSGIHAALFARAIGACNGVELNSPQFTPSANAEWFPRLSDLFQPTDGRHRLADWRPVGLGSSL